MTSLSLGKAKTVYSLSIFSLTRDLFLGSSFFSVSFLQFKQMQFSSLLKSILFSMSGFLIYSFTFPCSSEKSTSIDPSSLKRKYISGFSYFFVLYSTDFNSISFFTDFCLFVGCGVVFRVVCEFIVCDYVFLRA